MTSLSLSCHDRSPFSSTSYHTLNNHTIYHFKNPALPPKRSKIKTALCLKSLCLAPGDTEDTDIRDRIRIRIRPGKTLKLHFPEGYGVCPTSTTEVEPLSDHGAPPRARRIAAAHVALPRASRHFSARETVVVPSFLNPVSHMYSCTSRVRPTAVLVGLGLHCLIRRSPDQGSLGCA